jgi:2-keto-4-pentenoate hydratase/2-oxohepta-3-ene-1,7-dioic acid hydratase in catechol pathway
MKLVRYGKAGAEKPGLLDRAGRIRDLSAQIPDIAAPAPPRREKRLAVLIPRASRQRQPRLRLRRRCREFHRRRLNYADHAKEAGDPIPAELILFNKAHSCISGPDDDIDSLGIGEDRLGGQSLPSSSGRGRAYADEAEARRRCRLLHCNDVSERQFQTDARGTWSRA